jgi:hypothetical protein
MPTYVCSRRDSEDGAHKGVNGRSSWRPSPHPNGYIEQLSQHPHCARQAHRIYPLFIVLEQHIGL